MKILITGVAGFIGSNLAQRLIAELPQVQIIGIDDLSSGRPEQIPEQVQFHKLDIRSPDIYPHFIKADHVFHLAAKNCIQDCQEDPVTTAAVNVVGMVNVFEAAKRAKVPKVTFAESSALYEGCANLPSGEGDLAPESFYAVSKFSGLPFARSYERFFGQRFTGLRYFNVYGPRQDYRRSIPPVMSAFIIRLLQGRSPVIYGDGEKRRDFIHVDDVNAFHLLCLKDPRTDGRVFNVGSGDNLSVREIYQLVCDLLETHQPVEFCPDFSSEAQETRADTSAARSVGWQPQVGIREGLKGMISFIKDEISKGQVEVGA